MCYFGTFVETPGRIIQNPQNTGTNGTPSVGRFATEDRSRRSGCRSRACGLSATDDGPETVAYRTYVGLCYRAAHSWRADHKVTRARTTCLQYVIRAYKCCLWSRGELTRLPRTVQRLGERDARSIRIRRLAVRVYRVPGTIIRVTFAAAGLHRIASGARALLRDFAGFPAKTPHARGHYEPVKFVRGKKMLIFSF